MYISKYNAFFIHIPKTGGTSIEFYFLRDMGINVNIENNVSVFNNNRDLYLGEQNRIPIAHCTGQMLQDHDKFINSEYRFAIVRHPVERFLSEYVWRKKNSSIGGIDSGTSTSLLNQLLNDLKDPKVRDLRLLSCWDYCSIDNKLCVDDVFRLEDISHMQQTLTDKLGIPFVMSHENRTIEEKPTLTKSQLDIIRSVWAKDFEEFNYD